MKRLIMPLLAVLLAFAFWPTFAANTVTDFWPYTSSLDIDQVSTDAVTPVPPANYGTGSALTDDNLPVDTDRFRWAARSDRESYSAREVFRLQRRGVSAVTWVRVNFGRLHRLPDA